MQLERRRIAAMPEAEGASGTGYTLVRRAIDFLTLPNRGRPRVGDLAACLGFSAADLERVLTRWCGLSAEDFVHALTIEHIRGLLAASATVFDGGPTSSGPVHALNVRIADTVTDDARRRGAGLDITYGFHACPFGEALVLMTPSGICGLAFVDEDTGESRREALDDMTGRWPKARFRAAPEDTGSMASRIFDRSAGNAAEPVPLALMGTPFDLQVWQALLRIPMGHLVSYTDIARALGHPAASRAVGTANGRNPISFVVPCHRVLRGDGALGGYYWGLARKRALIAWETGRVRAAM
jgi:AraC family transcriptional regulator, regulatory protein of adaptative response / methylated-DNA-[protein]-cysteine methyltransferase